MGAEVAIVDIHSVMKSSTSVGTEASGFEVAAEWAPQINIIGLPNSQ